MTLQEIQALLASIDPDIRHYFSMEENKDYSFWEETRRLPFMADDVHEEAWAFYVHRFTKQENDEIAQAFFSTLDADPRVAVRHTVDFLQEDGYIHHVFECEGY